MLAFVVGCYASHERACVDDTDCAHGDVCELRALCVERAGRVECDPLRPGYGCGVSEGRIACESNATTGLGLCLEPRTVTEVWR